MCTASGEFAEKAVEHPTENLRQGCEKAANATICRRNATDLPITSNPKNTTSNLPIQISTLKSSERVFDLQPVGT